MINYYDFQHIPGGQLHDYQECNGIQKVKENKK